MDQLLNIVLIVVVCGFIAWVINEVPFIDWRFKQIGIFAILVICVILVLKLIMPSISLP